MSCKFLCSAQDTKKNAQKLGLYILYQTYLRCHPPPTLNGVSAATPPTIVSVTYKSAFCSLCGINNADCFAKSAYKHTHIRVHMDIPGSINSCAAML